MDSEIEEFYNQLPFNICQTLEQQVSGVTNFNQIEDSFPDLHTRLKESTGLRVLDVGCGIGWLANSIAHYYAGHHVFGIDFSDTAIERARAVAHTLNLSSTFEVKFLNNLSPDEHYDVICAMGVLHHTEDPRTSLKSLVKQLTRQENKGILYLGLYHKYGRGPFLQHFRKLILEKGRLIAFEEFEKIFAIESDNLLVESWFRDQFEHPKESHHTLSEVSSWLDELGLEVISTSINRFSKIDKLQDLFLEETTLEEVSRKRLSMGQFYPGFFTVLAEVRKEI